MKVFLVSVEDREYKGNMYRNVFVSLEDGKTGQFPADNLFDFKPFVRKDCTIELDWRLFEGKFSPRVVSAKLEKA